MNDLTGPESSAEREYRRVNGSSFGAAAAAYAEHRPDYAEAAVRWALEPVSAQRPLRVLDLAAGTGKLTAALDGLHDLAAGGSQLVVATHSPVRDPQFYFRHMFDASSRDS